MTAALDVLGPLAGGLGLFLLGMGMMTDGLRLAAGPALHEVLTWATRTRWHGLASGFLVTTAMQSSSAVTVAAIGFINAGLLGLGPALWVLFGANVGSTTTAWIVATVGLKFKIEAFALPLVGLGMLLRLAGSGRRQGHLGGALAGFGLLFVGISLLQQAFSVLTGLVDLPQGRGLGGLLAQMGTGLVMTVLMQSSAASMAIALTAAQGGLIDAQGAAAVVIGANVGTTVTAVLAAIGATPNARRAASGHVVFNLLTAAVALALLPWMIEALAWARAAMDLPPDPAVKLALFHTSFNVLGVALMWPLAAPLTRALQQRFRLREEDEAQPRHLDDNVLTVPTLALDALTLECSRIGGKAQQLTRDAARGVPLPALQAGHRVLQQLDDAAERFVERMNRGEMAQGTAVRLADTLRRLRYHETAAELALVAAGLSPLRGPQDAALTGLQDRFARALEIVLDLCGRALPQAVQPAPTGSGGPAPSGPAVDDPTLHLGLAAMEARYQALKAGLLAAGAAGDVALGPMEEALRRHSALRRAAQQCVKAVLRVRDRTPGTPDDAEPDPPAFGAAAEADSGLAGDAPRARGG
jgi:phosphate:Na+ symporter